MAEICMENHVRAEIYTYILVSGYYPFVLRLSYPSRISILTLLSPDILSNRALCLAHERQ
jgi:hypothetical protein